MREHIILRWALAVAIAVTAATAVAGCSAAPLAEPLDNSSLAEPGDLGGAANDARGAADAVNNQANSVEQAQPGGTQEP